MKKYLLSSLVTTVSIVTMVGFYGYLKFDLVVSLLLVGLIAWCVYLSGEIISTYERRKVKKVLGNKLDFYHWALNYYSQIIDRTSRMKVLQNRNLTWTLWPRRSFKAMIQFKRNYSSILKASKKITVALVPIPNKKETLAFVYEGYREIKKSKGKVIAILWALGQLVSTYIGWLYGKLTHFIEQAFKSA